MKIKKIARSMATMSTQKRMAFMQKIHGRRFREEYQRLASVYPELL
jgi:hypothetical protein